MSRVIHFVPDVSMSNGHRGLLDIMKKKRLKLDDLGKGEFVCFVNKGFTAMKLLATGGKVLVHWRHEKDEPLYTTVVGSLPNILATEDIGYAPGIAKAISDYYIKGKE